MNRARQCFDELKCNNKASGAILVIYVLCYISAFTSSQQNQHSSFSFCVGIQTRVYLFKADNCKGNVNCIHRFIRLFEGCIYLSIGIFLKFRLFDSIKFAACLFDRCPSLRRYLILSQQCCFQRQFYCDSSTTAILLLVLHQQMQFIAIKADPLYLQLNSISME